MNVKEIKRVYFVGVGGIGMSAIARFFLEHGAIVCGYDRTETELTKQLASEGIEIHYTDDVSLLDPHAQLVVYTPAIPKNHAELNWYQTHNYFVYKRSDVLQWITEAYFSITVAGTHGKTTISTMIAFLLRETNYGCNAFLGGISVNYESNYWSNKRETAVIEADEYDRSFLKLQPDIAVLTSIDPDHLDIYGTPAQMEDAFIQYVNNIKPTGTLVVKQGLHRQAELVGPQTKTYSLKAENADYRAANININNGEYVFDVICQNEVITDIHLPIGGLHNVENAVAAIAVTQLLGMDSGIVKKAFANFKGVKRRFEYIIKSEKIVFIDDYAHHPAELAALINSAKHLFANRKCVICFQPHLFTRTRDLVDGFAKSLDLADEVLLLDIYPARELPIDGVTSTIITNKMKNSNYKIVSKEYLLEYINNNEFELFITAGAGDIDKLVAPIKNILSKK